MAFSKYPESLDDSSTLPVSVDNVTPVNAEVVNRLRSSVISTQTELGTVPSGNFETVKARLDNIDVTLNNLAANIGLGEGSNESLNGRVTTLETNLSSLETEVTSLESTITSVNVTLTSHVTNSSNPHSTTAAQVGAPNIIASTTDEALVRFDGTSGQMQNSINGPFAIDAGELRLINNVNLTGRNLSGSTWVPLIGIDASNQINIGGLGNIDVIINANNNLAANISNSRVSLNGYLEVNSSLGTTAFPSVGAVRIKGGANNNGVYFQSTLGAAVPLVTHDSANNIVLGSNTAGSMGGLFPSVPTGQGMFLRIGGTAHLSLDETDMDVIVPMRLSEQGGDPANSANTGAIYSKKINSLTELFYIDDAGTVTQITSDGYLNTENASGGGGATFNGARLSTTGVSVITSITGSDTWTLLATGSTTLDINTSDWSSPSNGALQYDGYESIYAEITFLVTFTSVALKTFEFAIAIDGTEQQTSFQSLVTANAFRHQCVCKDILILNGGEIIEPYVQNITDGTDPDLKSFNMQVKVLGSAA